MTRKRYNYRYLVNNEQVSKETFIERLQRHHFKCDTHYDNPLMNISTLDEKSYNRDFNALKSQRLAGITYCYDSIGKSEHFSIKREEIR